MRHGTLEWQNGDKYVGAFKTGQMHGEGVLYCANGDSYSGEWKANMVCVCKLCSYATYSAKEKEKCNQF
jgi:hypothetical protein